MSHKRPGGVTGAAIMNPEKQTEPDRRAAYRCHHLRQAQNVRAQVRRTQTQRRTTVTAKNRMPHRKLSWLPCALARTCRLRRGAARCRAAAIHAVTHNETGVPHGQARTHTGPHARAV